MGRSTSSETLSDLRHWQIEEFLRQTGKAENTQRAYKRQLKNFSAWCNKSWLDVTPSDIGNYRQELKQQKLKPTSINHALNTLRAFYQWLRRSNGYPVNQPLPTDAIGLERVEEPQDLHIEKEDLADIWQAQMLQSAWDAGIRSAWVVADEVYGNDGGFWWWLEKTGDQPYVLTVNKKQSVVIGWQSYRAEALCQSLLPEQWQRLSGGQGSKGEREY